MSSPRYEGWLLAGRYRLLAGLGRGGMATVWRARDELLRREVAVKEVEIPDHLAGPEREVLLERTMREARLAARLSHPNIAAVYDVVRADDCLWIVMQLVRSRNLAEVVAEEGPMPAPALARVGLEVLSALEAAHAAGVMHRDVKPANILLTDDGHAILTDFGLATAIDEEAGLTRTGMVVGTPAYIAPERAGGVASSAESDLWSFGATLYAAVEGRSAFGRSTALATLAAVLTAEPEPFRRAGPLAPVIAGLLDKDPARRTGIARARKQLGNVATLGEQDEDSATEPFRAVRVAAPTTGRRLIGPSEYSGHSGASGADRRSTGHRLHEGAGGHPTDHHPRKDTDRYPIGHHPREDVGGNPTGHHPDEKAGPTSARQRITERRRLATAVAALTVGILAVVTVAVTAEWRSGGSGPPQRVAPSGAAPVTTPSPARTPETMRVTHPTATPRGSGRADVAPRATTTGSPRPGTSSGPAEKEANPNSNKYKTKDKKYKPPGNGNGPGNSKNH